MASAGQGILVTGTDTGVGKTFVSTILLRQLAEQGVRVTGLKPVASGCLRTGEGLRSDDAWQLIEASSVPLEYAHANRYAFQPPVPPHLAAAAEGVEIEPLLVRRDLDLALKVADYAVVEGVGGWRVPISSKNEFPDLARELALPVLLVVGIRLGCINHALLTADAISRSGLTLRAWVANRLEPGDAIGPDSIAAIEQRMKVPLLGTVPYVSDGVRSASGLPDLARALLEQSG